MGFEAGLNHATQVLHKQGASGVERRVSVFGVVLSSRGLTLGGGGEAAGGQGGGGVRRWFKGTFAGHRRV